MATLKDLVAEVRRVWSPPGTRAWSMADVAIVRLLKAIEDLDPSWDGFVSSSAYEGARSCPFCARFSTDGHAPNCQLRILHR